MSMRLTVICCTYIGGTYKIFCLYPPSTLRFFLLVFLYPLIFCIPWFFKYPWPLHPYICLLFVGSHWQSPSTLHFSSYMWDVLSGFELCEGWWWYGVVRTM